MDTPPLTQEKLNQDMTMIGVGRYRSHTEQAKAREGEGDTKYGQRLMRAALPKFAKGIQDMIDGWTHANKARWQHDLMGMKPEVIGFIALRSCLDRITARKTMNSLACFVGARIEDQVRCDFLVKHSEKGEGIILGAKRRKKAGVNHIRTHVRRSMMHESDKGLMEAFDAWTQRDRANCGAWLVELLRDCTGLIEYVYIQQKAGRKRATRFVVATQTTLDWVENFNTDRELLEPFWLPTAETPREWENIWDGGYDTAGTTLPKLPFIKTRNMEHLREAPSVIGEPMEACNLIQQTPWRVNSEVLDVTGWAWENSLEITGFPSREDETLPPFSKAIHEDKEALTRWKMMAAGVYKRNASTKSRRLLVGKVLYLADKMRATRFFYPSNCDFRGRVYNIPSFLGIQGPDMCRGLLKFSRGEKVKTNEAYRWLAIHGANTWGNDKVTLDKRVQWANDFAKDAQKIAANPKRELLWTEADKPFQFLAWCFEWAKLTSTGKLETFLPVSMDASNNGLQILSMLIRDPYGMSATNVLPTETPADIYKVVAERVEGYLRKDASEGRLFSKEWLQFGITRSTCKRPVMCYSYGLTSYSNRAYVVEWFEDEIHDRKRTSPFDPREKIMATNYLATLVWRGIEEVLEKPKEVMQWFQQCSRLISDKQRPLFWNSPSGFPVIQDYKQLHSKRVKTWVSGEATWIRFNEESDKICRRKQANGVSPNFVHALDASALHKTVVRANREAGIYDFAMVHDSYGTHATKCDDLSRILRDVFVNMFEVDLLSDWSKQLSVQHPDISFPAPPAFGEAKITKIHDSTYFFS